MANKLYEPNPIEIWGEIAYQVQRLSIKEYSEKEFYENLKKLTKLLSKIDLDLPEFSSRYPIDEREVGLATLLQYIYSIKDVDMCYKKARFYEKINQLVDLGVDYVVFQPTKPLPNIEGIKDSYLNWVYTQSKVYTDGSFDLEEINFEEIYIGYVIKNITRANYLLHFTVEKESGCVSLVKEGIAYLCNFNGNYPSMLEVNSLCQPNIYVPSQQVSFGQRPKSLEERFDFFDESYASYQKRLTRTKDGQYYYKEYTR